MNAFISYIHVQICRTITSDYTWAAICAEQQQVTSPVSVLEHLGRQIWSLTWECALAKQKPSVYCHCFWAYFYFAGASRWVPISFVDRNTCTREQMKIEKYYKIQQKNTIWCVINVVLTTCYIFFNLEPLEWAAVLLCEQFDIHVCNGIW